MNGRLKVRIYAEKRQYTPLILFMLNTSFLVAFRALSGLSFVEDFDMARGIVLLTN